MAIEIVSFPINSIVIFHSYVNVFTRRYFMEFNGKQSLMAYRC